jgi:hypothetical protein
MNDQKPRSLDASPVQRQNILNNPYANCLATRTYDIISVS